MDFMGISLAFLGFALGIGLGWALLSGRLSSLRARVALLAAELEKAQSERTEFHERAIAAETTNRAMEARLLEREEQLKLEFKDTANGIFENISKKFSTQSEKQIGDLLNPLRERLTDFQKLVTDSFVAQGKEQHTLKSEIEKIVLQTDSLTKALRGDVKAQGNWGEVILERILEESGLTKGIGYTVQGTELGLVSEDGRRQQPDVIINLPDAKQIIVDSKVSLTHYERYCAENDEAQKEMQLKLFIKSIRQHVAVLEGKRYQDNEKLITPDFVLMFMPVEGAYSTAMQHDADLHQDAWKRKIVIVCPTTLFATLRTIASLWRIEQQSRNAEEIARQGGALYDKFVTFIENMQDIGGKLGTLQKSYDSAMQRLSTGHGNLVARVEKLKKLGSKTSKSLPAGTQFDDGDEEEAIMQLPAANGN